MAPLHHSRYWKRRAEAERRARPMCAGCRVVGRVTVGELVDHVIPLSAGGSIRGETQVCCRECHTVKRKLEELYRQGKCSAADLKFTSELAVEFLHQHYRIIDSKTGWPISLEERRKALGTTPEPSADGARPKRRFIYV
jgi:hypothetical protein